jgi:hypothetical protein
VSPLDVSKMTREQRDRLRAELLRQHPHLADAVLESVTAY